MTIIVRGLLEQKLTTRGLVGTTTPVTPVDVFPDPFAAAVRSATPDPFEATSEAVMRSTA